MKKILILFLLCGLNLPTFVQAAEAVALDEALSSAFREAVDGGLGDDFTAALRTVLGKDNGAELLNTIKSSPAFKKMMAGMDSVGGDLLTPEARAAALKAATTTALKQMSRDFKPLTGETETAAIKRFTEGFGKETGAMRTEMLGNMEDSALAVLEQKMVGQDRAEVALQIQALNKAFTDFKAGTKNAFSEFRSVDTSAMEPAINRLAENVEGPLAKLGGGQALKDSQSAAVEDGGRDDLVVTAGANSTQKGFFTRLGNRASSYVKTKWGDFREEANTAAGLTDKIGARAKDIEALESMQARTTAFIDRNAQGQLEISSAAFNRTDVDKDALESFFKEGRGVVKFDSSGTEIETTTESVMKNADGSFTIKIRCVAGGNVDGDSFTYIVKNPSQEETRIFGTMADRERSDLAGSGKFFLSKTGKLRFISSTEFGEGFEGRLADLRKQIVSAKEELTDLTAQRKSQEYAYQKFNRTVISFVKALPDVILSPIKTLGKLWDQVIGIFKHLMEVGKMILQGVFFGIPSMIYQALMQAAQTAALYQQITAPVQVSGNFWLQIPTFLIPRTNPNSGTFLYVAVPAGGYDFGNDGSDSFLQTASYYVLYQEGAPWGQTYANSPNAPSGVWVNLNTGLIFTDGGNPANPQTPYAYLLQPVSATQVQAVQGAQPTLSVEEFIETIFDNVGSERTLVSFNQSWKDIDPFQIVPSSVSITVNPMLRKLFKSFTVTSGSGVTNFAVKVNNSTQVSESQKVYPAPLLTPTLNQFRNGIKNVRGFLPSTLKEANPVMSLKQFTGTGALNRLLGDPTVSVSPDNAVAILNEVKDATTALESAQQALATVLANPSQSSADLANALDALETAQTAFSTALNEVRVPGVGKPGMDPSYDVNGYSIYLYETEDTPIAQFLKANNPSALIPAKDYVLFLDENNTIVPIFEATLQTQKSGVTAIAYNTGQINSSIRYMCSLVTGLTYIYDENNPGSIALNGGIPDMSIASAAIGNLLQSIALVLYSSAPANDLINQVTAMANYATALAHEGPFIRNQRTLTRVDWDTFTNSTTAQQQRTQSFMSGLSGQQIAASSAIKQYSFGSPVSPAAQAAWLDCLYVYEVSGGPSRSSSASSSTGQSAPLPGCFGAVNGQPVYDYVVPLAQSATGAYQIMPLGVTEALGNVPIQGFAPVQALVSLVTGNLYDANYNLISGLTTVVKRTDRKSVV